VAGVKMPRIIMAKFWEHHLPLPPLSEQRRIVEILDQADALRRKRTEADAKAERILTAVFYEMFGDPATNPNGLRKQRLGTLISVRSGNFLPEKNMDKDGVFPVYGGNGINGYHSSYMLDNRTIIIGRVVCSVAQFITQSQNVGLQIMRCTYLRYRTTSEHNI
jgi:type I restriction enzyme, S subunit